MFGVYRIERAYTKEEEDHGGFGMGLHFTG